MAVEVRVLMKMDRDGEWQDDSAILVCNTTGRPLNLPVNTFDDCDDADSFLSWCHTSRGPGDPRTLDAAQLESAVDRWRVEHPSLASRR